MLPALTEFPAVQRSTTGGRLVVLPPVRTDDRRDASAPDQPSREVIFESPRPVGLQRMFQHSSAPSDSAPPFRAVAPRPTGLASGPIGSAWSPAADSGAARSEPNGTGYEPGTTTITFAAPVLQRETDSATPSPEPAPEPAPASAPTPAMGAVTTAAPAGVGHGGDVDELVNRLYDPLAARLRAELWLDRERAGVLMDLGH